MDREKRPATESAERRAHRRIPLDARIRVRPVGSKERGRPCRVSESSARGLRLVPDARLDASWDLLEVVTGRAHGREGPVMLRVVWTEERETGDQRVGCVFEP